MKLGWLALIFTCTVCVLPEVAGAADVEFPDEQLDQVIREILKKKQIDKLDRSKKITEDDLSTIFFLEAPHRGIKRLTGLEKCRNLALVRLTGNEIEDVSPLAECQNIQSLDLARNRIQDVSPLGKLAKLQYLQLEDNQISDISPLGALKSLNALYISRNQVESLAGLEGMPKLISLYAEKNKLCDIAPIGTLRWLSNLDLKDNQIEDVSPLSALTELRWTFLERNRITNIKPLVEMARRDFEGSKRFAPFWHLYLTGNPIDDESKVLLSDLQKMGVRVKFE